MGEQSFGALAERGAWVCESGEEAMVLTREQRHERATRRIFGSVLLFLCLCGLGFAAVRFNWPIVGFVAAGGMVACAGYGLVVTVDLFKVWFIRDTNRRGGGL